MKKITLIFAFFSLIVGMNAQQHRLIPISLQKWSQKNAVMYTATDKEAFEKGGDLPNPYQIVEGITNPNAIYAKTRAVAKKRSSLHAGQISDYLKKEITLEDYYANLHTLRITFDSVVKVNAWDELAPQEEGWLRHPPGTYDFICYVDPETHSVFPTNHPICLNATNKTSLFAVVNGTARVASSNEDESGEVPFDPEDDQANAIDAARKKAAELQKRKNPDTAKNPYAFETADGKAIIFAPYIHIDGARNVAVNKGTESADQGDPHIHYEEVPTTTTQLRQPQPQAQPQSQYRQPSCAYCGGTNNQHYSNCPTLNRVATNSCNGCGNSGNYGVVRQKPDAAAITGAVFSGLNLGYNVLTDVFAPNGRFRKQSAPVNIYNTYPINPTNPGTGYGVDYGAISTTGGTTTTGQGNDFSGVTDYVSSGLNGNGGGLVNSGGAGLDGGGIIP